MLHYLSEPKDKTRAMSIKGENQAAGKRERAREERERTGRREDGDKERRKRKRGMSLCPDWTGWITLSMSHVQREHKQSCSSKKPTLALSLLLRLSHALTLAHARTPSAGLFVHLIGRAASVRIPRCRHDWRAQPLKQRHIMYISCFP